VTNPQCVAIAVGNGTLPPPKTERIEVGVLLCKGMLIADIATELGGIAGSYISAQAH